MMKTTLRLDPIEYHTAKALADSKNMALAEYLRQLVVEKNTPQVILDEMKKMRDEVSMMLDAIRQEVGRLNNDLIKTIRDGNELLAEDMEKKLAAELDDQRAELVELITRFAKAQPARPGTAGPLKTPTSSLY